MIRQVIILLLIFGFVSVLLPNSLDACPACKNLDEAIARGFKWSVVFMIAMPFNVFGVIGGSVYYHFSRSKTA
ncbi:hypothetical protein F4225_00240 [Candidatus Poribacteria bacterium]|nr:hypothetical protein [Candidatus Poribacteria bacterium]